MDISGFKELMKNEDQAYDALDKFYRCGYSVLRRHKKVKGLFISDCGLLFVDDFGDSKNRLRSLLVVIREINKGKPFLGICLGLQLLFTYSQEHTLAPGMNIIKGEVVKFTNDLKIPHMGWNQVEYTNNELTKKLFKNIPQKAYFYFVHSYYVKPKEEAIIVATTWYGEIFPSAVVKNNIVGVQFHPEKSGDMGLKFLKNFLEIYGNAC